MLTRTLQFFGLRKTLRVPVEDMAEVLRFEKERHKPSLVFDSEITRRNHVAFRAEYNGVRVVYRGMLIEPGKTPVLGRRYEG